MRENVIRTEEQLRDDLEKCQAQLLKANCDIAARDAEVAQLRSEVQVIKNAFRHFMVSTSQIHCGYFLVTSDTTLFAAFSYYY